MKFFERFSSPSEPRLEQKSGGDIHLPEHLREGVSPIFACVGTFEQLKNDPELKKIREPQNTSEFDNVDYYGNPASLREGGFKTGGRESYVISPVDALNKISRSLADCTGIIAAGRDKDTDGNISLLSHQDPTFFLSASHAGRKIFLNDLEERMHELQERSMDKTIDAAIFGGRVRGVEIWSDGNFNRRNYLESIKLLSEEIKKIFGFEPVVITGPKNKSNIDSENVYYDNNHRRLYILRPEVGDSSTESFMPSDIDAQNEKWKSEPDDEPAKEKWILDK